MQRKFTNWYVFFASFSLTFRYSSWAMRVRKMANGSTHTWKSSSSFRRSEISLADSTNYTIANLAQNYDENDGLRMDLLNFIAAVHAPRHGSTPLLHHHKMYFMFLWCDVVEDFQALKPSWNHQKDLLKPPNQFLNHQNQ